MHMVRVTNEGTAAVNGVPIGGRAYFAVNHGIRVTTGADGLIINTIGTTGTAFTASATILIEMGTLVDSGRFSVALSSRDARN